MRAPAVVIGSAHLHITAEGGYEGSFAGVVGVAPKGVWHSLQEGRRHQPCAVMLDGDSGSLRALPGMVTGWVPGLGLVSRV